MNRLLLASLAIAALASLVYGNAPANRFALDDEFIILHNDAVHGLDRLDDALASPYWPKAPGRIGMYRPLTSASFALEWDLWGPARPAGFHLTNVLLHALVSVLVLLLLHRLAGPAPAMAGAALFAVHPVHVEAVANLVGRGELLAAAFSLLAARLYLREGTGRARVGGAAAIGALYFLSLASKEIGVTLPGALLILEAVRGGGSGGGVRGWAGRVVERWPVYAMTVVALAAYLVLRLAVLDTVLGNSPAPYLATESGLARVLTAISVWPEYARLMVFPAALTSDYSPAVLLPQTGLTLAVVAGVLTGAGAAALVVLTWRRAPLVAAGIGWFAVTVLPVSNLPFPVDILLAERTLYLPSVGVALGVAGGVRLLLSHDGARARPAAVAGALLLALAAARTWTRTPVWEDTDTVLSTLAAEHPESFRVQWMLGAEALAEGRVEEGLGRFAVAVDLMPSHYQLRYQFARGLMAAGMPSEAAGHLEVARRLVPEHPEAPILLAHVLRDMGRAGEAARIAQDAVTRFPAHRGGWHQLALARADLGDYAAALTAREASLRLAGETAHWQQWVHAAELQLRLGRPAAARTALAHAHDTAPPDVTVPCLDRLVAALETGAEADLPYR